jgi:DNA repair exonuclease SbcCD ATPase subunit
MESGTLTVENIGGIERTEADIPPGVTVLASPNASNKTSFLRSVMAALGSDQVSIKGDADEGSVSLELDGTTYERYLERTGAGMRSEGNPYLDDSEIADLFAFLLKSNEARRAVQSNVDLRELIMRPVDTEEIKDEIERCQRERDRIDEDLDEIDSLKQRLPELEERKRELQDQVEDKRAELEELEGEIEDADASVENQREEREELEDALEELRDVRSTLEDVRYEIEAKRKRLSSLKEERGDLESEIDDLADVPEDELDNIESHVGDLRSQKQQLDAEISELQQTIQFNEKMIDEATGGTHPAVDIAADGGDGAAVTDQLLDQSQETVCWTCGSEVAIDQIEDTVSNLRDLRREKLDSIDDIESELDEYKRQKKEYESQQRERDEAQRRLARVENDIESTESALDNLTERKDDLTDEVETLEERVENLESDSYEDVLELHRDANDLEYELGRVENERDEVEAEIEEIESRVAEADDLRDQREQLQDELTDLRTRIDQIEADAVEQFNDHMEQLLSILDYDNIERIWIEIVEEEVRQGRRKTTERTFELHVIRSSDGGVAYEDTVDHLSDTEREVTGLVFALAGYLVHDVHEEVPVMIMDALEPIDSERIAALIEYFESYVDYLVVALLPEDADALEIDHHRITDIGV